MAQIILSEIPESTVTGFNKTKKIQTTATPFISPTLSSIERAIKPTSLSVNFNIEQFDLPSDNVEQAEQGFLRGRRPSRGLLFPRGYFNR